MIASTACFAVMNLFVRFAARIPAHEQVLIRAAVTLVVGFAILCAQRTSPWGRNHPLLVARGLAGSAALLLYFHTLHTMPLATAVTLQNLSPIFTVLISAVLLGEKPRIVQLPFFLVAFVGVVVIRGVDVQVTLAEVVIGVAAALLAGLAYNFVRMLKDFDPPMVVVFWFPLVTVPLVLPWSLTHWVAPTPVEWAWLLLIGLATTAGQVFLSMAYQRSRASEVSALNFLGVVYALILGLVLFGEDFGLRKLAGVAMIAIGVLLGTRLARGRDPDGDRGLMTES
jgi:drug/metabolite transporter (DMT)-like permease